MNPIEQAHLPPPLPSNSQFFEPMPEAPGVASVLEALLKFPGRIIYELFQPKGSLLLPYLGGGAIAGIAIYGIVVGSFVGGSQLLIAPAKLVLGIILAVTICFPSLYIFYALSGIDVRIRTVAGAFLGTVCLAALLLIGFAPVAWIFSESAESIGFIASLHLFFWAVALGFGMRLLRGIIRFAGGTRRNHLRLWSVIFLLVCLQMTTTLRPIIGRSDRFFPGEKKFFLSYWLETLSAKSRPQRQTK